MLTERKIRDTKPGPKTALIWDGQVRGLGLRVTPGGTKAFILNYRVDGRERRATLGRVSELSLKAARELAGRELAAIRAGGGDPLERRREAKEAPTVAEGLARFFEEYAPARIADGRLRDRTVADYRKQAEGTLLPAIGRLKIAKVTRADIERAIAPRAPVQRNRTLAFASRLFNLFEAWEWRPAYSNPCRHVEKAREEPRDRTLSPSEFAALAKALDMAHGDKPAAVDAIRFAAVTGLRIGEVLAVQWGHIDFETGRLTMPETKNGRRMHDLSTAALAVLANRPRFHGNPWAFTSDRGGKPTAYHTTRMTFRTVCEAAGLADVRLHDLRRSLMTAAAAAGVGPHVLRDLLGHKTTAMADRYVRAVGNPVREAREAMGNQIAAMMDGQAGEVVPLRRRG